MAARQDANFDMVGFKNTLKLRAELEGGDPNANPDEVHRSILSQRALGGM